MNNIILHVGHGKTGTSYLQSCIAINRDKLLDHGILYPSDNPLEGAIEGRISSGNGKGFIQTLSGLKVSGKNILFSNEGLFNTLLGKDSEQFYCLLSSEIYSFHVIIYSRNLFEHSFSRWGQSIKRHKCTDDLNAFLLKSPYGPYPAILKWIELSKTYNFKLTIRNYSKHRKNLVNTFFSDINLKDFAFEPPSVKNVNRSLTAAEIDIQRVFNNTKFSIPPVSDDLVNCLPEIKPVKLRCSREAYDFVVSKNYGTFEKINRYLNEEDSLEIECSEKCVFDDVVNYSPLNSDQIHVISDYISQNLQEIAPHEITQIFKIAMRISNSKADLADALWLMEFALKQRPGGQVIKRQVEKLKSRLSRVLT